jgi:transposase
MNQGKPKAYTAELRGSAVKLANGSDKPVAQTARDIGVNENTLPTWISKYSRPAENAKAVRTGDHLYDELKRLKKEAARLAEERNLLLRALGGKKGGSVPFGFAQDRLCQGTTVDCRDAGGRAPTVGALGDAGAVAGKYPQGISTHG